MQVFNIYLIGVGGQGIGLLSEIILRAADHAGHEVRAVDTHGLAQRGGSVVSQIRLGPAAHSPLIRWGEADLIVALECHEALRALARMPRPGSSLVYYDTSWQPLSVRLAQAEAVSAAGLEAACRQRGVSPVRVRVDDLPETRMQNMAVLACVHRHRMIPGLAETHYLEAMGDLMTSGMLESNRRIFQAAHTGQLLS
jgi:indolepyruvate ferredoxin oxidoreductase beta subunit